MKKIIGSKFLLLALLTVLVIGGCAPAPTTVPLTSAPLPTNTPFPTDTPVPTNTPLPTDTPIPLLESIAGIWTGVDEGTVGGEPSPGREIEVTILADCSIGSVCGTVTNLVNGELCVSSLTLIEVKDETYAFEGKKKEGSASFCGEGGSYTLQPMPDSTLSYALDTYNSAGKRVKKTAIMNLSPTLTEATEPTPSGKFEFFDVTIDQAGKDTVLVSFGYQLEQGLDLNGVMIMADASTEGASCSSGRFSTFSKPYVLNESVSGIVKGADAASISMTESGKCSFKGFTLMVFRVEGNAPAVLYQQEFEMPFELEK